MEFSLFSVKSTVLSLWLFQCSDESRMRSPILIKAVNFPRNGKDDPAGKRESYNLYLNFEFNDFPTGRMFSSCCRLYHHAMAGDNYFFV